MNLYDVTLAQLMYVLAEESKYSSRFYHYLEETVEEPIPCDVNDIDLTLLNKHDFGMLKCVKFEGFSIRSRIEEETERRKHAK